MLPLQQAYEIKHSIIEYLKATFSFNDKAVHDAFYSFITNQTNGIFKGPYISLKLPFVKAANSDAIPLDIKPNFPPYDHQWNAFNRLTTQNGNTPLSTLITTGTSSGKTECFLFPVLDYCYKNLNRRGIKVIILYPMNALATDQAKRLAEAIWEDEKLKGKISVGLFIGEGKEKRKFASDMGPDHVIENRNSIVDSPPDILLTNFKMLDYALMRSNYHELWNFNLNDPSLLQFLVLDELHTYDGAQGTDVANLIRRLKLKLAIPKGQLCAVGTSATIGSGVDSKKMLIEYAQKVFGEHFDQNALITENRQSVDDFFGSDTSLEKFLPRQIGLLDSRLGENETYQTYINRQKRLWQIPDSLNEVALGDELKKLKLVKDLVSITSDGIKNLDDLMEILALKNTEFNNLSQWDDKNNFSPREEIIHSILALITEARSGETKKFPFLFLQVQLWIRELSGVLRLLGDKPKFIWKDETGDKYSPKAMPAYYCRECGASGWLGVKDDNKNHLLADASQVYEYFFGNHKNIYFINTPNHKHIAEYEPENTINEFLNTIDLSLESAKKNDSFKIHAVRKLRETKSIHVCPECNTENTLGIIGTRVATLSSISVSQILSSDLDPRAEKYRKILAFTNSVQDAAHQAGFIEARNYRFTFRASLQKIINQLGHPVTLAQLQSEFINFWKINSDESGANNEEAFFYRFLPADYKGKLDLDSDFRMKGKFTEEFKKEFDLRMTWEVISEFGYNALIGRTLEKSGASATRFDQEKIQQVYPLLQDWMAANNLGIINPSDFIKFLNGMLHRIRIRGGIDHEYLSKFRHGNLELRELNWWQDNRHFLNRNFGTRSRLPKLVTNSHHAKGMLDSTYTTTHNWFKDYFLKTFQFANSYAPIVNEFFTKLLDALVVVGILNKVENQNNNNYAINPQALIVENKVKAHECSSCGSTLNVAESDLITQDSRCLSYTCTLGLYRAKPKLRPNYYQLVYNRNRSPRIYAAEHTGLLERKDRENKEIDFKQRPNFNSLNAIVSTSTLEMGIDIGTLNAAINNSIPPLTSNFLQRVGRAGRSSGSALIANFAQNKPHDLYYYHEPIDMMDGEIATPACFLEAKDILFRHFFAFCLDKWALTDHKNNQIPAVIGSLKLVTANFNTPDFFPNRITSFIKSNENNFLNEFSNFYKPDLEDEKVLDLLKVYLIEESFYERLKKVFEKLRSEYQFILEKRKEIDEFIKTNKLGQADEERRMLESEKKALWGIKRMLDKRSLLEYLTNVGLLPNYAFPETGVTLNGRIYNFAAKGSSGSSYDKQFEMVRSAATAIRELAPDNNFYSQGYKFHVSGINIHDWKDAGTLIEKRFCSKCDHIEWAVKANEPVCPKCGDSSWASVKNKHVFVKLNGVKSVNSRADATLDDSSDDRDSSMYIISKHIRFYNSSVQGAWGMKEIPFGIEFVKNVDIEIVNLGLAAAVDANKININGIENIPSHGFITCKHCGKSTSKKIYENSNSQNKKRELYHYGYCKYKASSYKGKRDDIFEEVFLFREMKTEALKVLLPVQELDSEAQVLMFKAGLELGLKRYYKGNPQHLSTIEYQEFNKTNARFDRYLIIHDNIAGGTGYLEKLFNPVEFSKVIALAYNEIKECSCQHNGKDGCYRCIYTYTNQNIQSELSRAAAEALFKKIVDKSNAWESYNAGLASISGNGQIEESELEDRFIRCLRNFVLKREPEGWYFEDFIQDGVVNYKLKVKKGDDAFSYFIRPQKELGTADDVAFRTRTDFYITLTDVARNGVSIEDSNLLYAAKDIAIYLDGYTFHATKENQRFASDLRKRVAIANSGNKLSWTLTWDDLQKFDALESIDRQDSLAIRPTHANTINAYRSIPYWQALSNEMVQAANSMDRLIWLMQNPLPEHQSIKKINLFLSLLQTNFGRPSVNSNEIETVINQFSDWPAAEKMATNLANGDFYIFPDIQMPKAGFVSLKAAIRVADLQMQARIFVDNAISEIPKEEWMQFWQTYNLIQSNCLVSFETESQDKYVNDKYNCLQYYDQSMHQIVRWLIDNDVQFENEGSFFLNFNDTFAEAWLGLESLKLAIHPLSDNDRNIFAEAGFTVIEPNDFNFKPIEK